MPTVLVTGAGRGLGFEFARQYAADGWRVIATCRNPAAKAKLADLDGEVEVHEADLARVEDIARLGREVGGKPIDVLISNAGLLGPRSTVFGQIDEAAWHEVMAVNAFAPLRVAETFADNVAASDQKKLIAITSQLGSIARNTGGGRYVYGPSKSALNAIMRSVAFDLAPRGIVTLMVHPGWVRTDMGTGAASLSTEQSVSAMRRLIARADRSFNGRFVDYDGADMPW